MSLWKTFWRVADLSFASILFPVCPGNPLGPSGAESESESEDSESLRKPPPDTSSSSDWQVEDDSPCPFSRLSTNQFSWFVLCETNGKTGKGSNLVVAVAVKYPIFCLSMLMSCKEFRLVNVACNWLHLTIYSSLCSLHLGIVAVIEGLVALGQGKLATLKSRELVSDCRIPDGNRRNVGSGRNLPRALTVAPRTGPGDVIKLSSCQKPPAGERDV